MMTRAEVVARMCRVAADRQPLAAMMDAALDELARCVRDDHGCAPRAQRPGTEIADATFLVGTAPLPWWPRAGAEGRR